MKKTVLFILILVSSLCPNRAPAQEAQGEKAATSGQSTQDKITLDIKGMDIVDVLKMLSQRAGFNIVVGKNVAGRVTLFLKDVSVWDAFEIILLGNELAYEKQGDIINIMTQRDYELAYGDRFKDKKVAKIIQLKYAKALDLSLALNQIKTNIGRVVVDQGSNTIAVIDVPNAVAKMEEFVKTTDLPTKTKVFDLSYAQADKLTPKLQESITKGIGSIKMDERTNKIAITDYPEKLDEIAKIISAFDEKTQQVLIDAQIIEVKPSDLFEMGIDWEYWIKKYFNVKAALPIGAANRLIVGTASPTPSGKGDYKTAIDILRTIGDTKVLSSPRVMALNNQEAKIHVGSRDAYITSTTSQGGTGSTVTSQSVNFVDTGIQLYVTPTINRDGFVTMKIKPEVSDSTRTDIKSEGQVTQIPIVTTSEAETTVMVKDGVTIIIGGLRKDKREKTVKQIPLLGDIPLLGAFFRSTSDNLTKTELVILLTPHIMSGETTFTEFSEIKPKEGAVLKMEKGQISTERISLRQKRSAIYDYYLLLIDRINRQAKLNKPEGKKGEVRLAFSLYSNGALIADPEIKSASEPLLIPLAVKAVKDSAPFPPFPDTGKEMEIFSISLDYK